MQFSTIRGKTSKAIPVLIKNTSGTPLTGLTYSTSGLTCYYRREGDATTTAVTLAAGTTGTWSSGGFVEVDATHTPGMYEFGVPNAALSSGEYVTVYFQGASGMAPAVAGVQLDAVNYQSATAFITAINSLAPPTNWNQTNIDSSGRLLLQPTQTGVTIPTVTTTTTTTNLTNAPTSGDFTSTMKTSLNSSTPSIGSTAPAGWINTAAFASGATLPVVTLVTTTTNLTNAPTTGDFTSTMKTSLSSATPTVTLATSQPNYAPATAAALTTLTTTVGTPAQASQIPSNFTTATFASAGVFATAALANAPTGGGGGITLSTVLNTPRALDSVADGSLTVNDALFSAIVAGVGGSSVNGASNTLMTPSTKTVIRTRTVSPASTITASAT